MTKPESCAPRALVLGLAAALAVASHAPAADCPAPDAAAGGPVNAHTRYLETTMLPAVADEDSKPRTLAERMAAWQVPGVTVAVIKSGKLDWARGWGVRDLSTCAPVTPETAFQAASISKPVFAMVLMPLAEAGTLDIDADIATQLTSWTLPAAPAISDAPITLRQLLSHESARDLGPAARPNGNYEDI
jgi:CubicO group peptidase (beta-lactamase class C family)